MQPVAFSLVEALEKEQDGRDDTTVEPIDTSNTEQLARLMDSLEPGMGSNFFSSGQTSEPTTSLEAHWNDIHVEDDGTVTCRLCEGNAQVLSYYKVVRAHCTAVYQPLKKYMTQHLKHVRYFRPSLRRPNPFTNRLDLIAGFASTGVMCGVYVTDIGIPLAWIKHRLAPGADEPGLL